MLCLVPHSADNRLLAWAGWFGRDADGAVLFCSTCPAHITRVICELSKSQSGWGTAVWNNRLSGVSLLCWSCQTLPQLAASTLPMWIYPNTSNNYKFQIFITYLKLTRWIILPIQLANVAPWCQKNRISFSGLTCMLGITPCLNSVHVWRREICNLQCNAIMVLKPSVHYCHWMAPTREPSCYL